MDFGEALKQLKVGKRIGRAAWNCKSTGVALQPPDPGVRMTRCYAFVSRADGAVFPWAPTQEDLFAEDWIILPR